MSYKPEISAEDGWEMRKEIIENITSKDKLINGDNFIISTSEAYSDQIISSFGKKSTKESAKEIINAFEDLEILEIVDSPKFILIPVSKGQEKKWITKLENEDLVEFTELNYLESLN